MRPSSLFNKFIAQSLRIFFHHLYHKFSWSYNSVAWIISLGQWNKWVMSVLDLLNSTDGGIILELGHGPGNLLVHASQIGLNIIGLDESAWMNKQAKEYMIQQNLKPKLLNGIAERLPIASASINQVVATFPSEYIYMESTLQEIHRVLISSGSLIILPYAWIEGQRVVDRLVAWLFRVTGQIPESNGTKVEPQIIKYIEKYGFSITPKWKVHEHSSVLILVAHKIKY